ncbi:head-tail connector protein [Streptomyces phaeochromogenes]|uniref:head-tail connector protein n=1 Tax=Streptomyces phaeochromogenes TaxID=1923 RepID=UPI0036BE7D6E
MPFDLGDNVRLTAECRNAAGVLADASGVTLTITLPDGTTATPAVTNPPLDTGQYRHDYATAQAGRHGVRWVFATPAAAYTDMFDVRLAVPPLILSLADARSHLRITSTSDDQQLREWLESITELVEQFCGPCVRRTVVETHDIPASGVRALALHRTPVLSLVSAVAVLDGGTDYAAADLDADEATGIVRRLDGGRMHGPLRFTYQVGRSVVPANLSSASRIILQHLWRTQYGASRAASGVGGGDDYAVTEPIAGFGYAIPNRALQLMEPHRLPPGVA